VATAAAASVAEYSQKVANLIDPAKLATLRERGANPRVEKYVALLAEAKAAGVSPKKVARAAVAQIGFRSDAARLTVEAMTRNLTIAERLGCLDVAGLIEMRRGQAPTVRRGPYVGDQLSVDHIIPRTVAPELDNVIANLELLPLRVNEAKNAAIGDRQRSLAKRLHRAGLLGKPGFEAVMRGRRKVG